MDGLLCATLKNSYLKKSLHNPLHNPWVVQGGGGRKSDLLVFFKCSMIFVHICCFCLYLLVFVCIWRHVLKKCKFVDICTYPQLQKHPHNPRTTHCTTYCTTPVFNTISLVGFWKWAGGGRLASESYEMHGPVIIFMSLEVGRGGGRMASESLETHKTVSILILFGKILASSFFFFFAAFIYLVFFFFWGLNKRKWIEKIKNEKTQPTIQPTNQMRAKSPKPGSRTTPEQPSLHNPPCTTPQKNFLR